MDDADLKRVAEAATPGPWDYDAGDFSIFALETFVPLEYTEANATYIATFDPPTVLSLLSRLSAAEARVGVLEEALREIADPGDAQVTATRLFEGAQEIARAALTQEPTS
jgi:hypothetical protein